MRLPQAEVGQKFVRKTEIRPFEDHVGQRRRLGRRMVGAAGCGVVRRSALLVKIDFVAGEFVGAGAPGARPLATPGELEPSMLSSLSSPVNQPSWHLFRPRSIAHRPRHFRSLNQY